MILTISYNSSSAISIHTKGSGNAETDQSNSFGSISPVKLVKIVPIIHLRRATCFSIYSINGAISVTDPLSIVTGEIGSMTGAISIPAQLSNTPVHQADSTAAVVESDLTNAYTQLTVTPCNLTIAVLLGNGQILTSGTYCTGAAASLEGNLILDGEGDPNARFIIKIDGAFDTGATSTVTLINGATFHNVYWLITGATTLGGNSTFQGSLLTTGAISITAGATLLGRALSTAGAISVTGPDMLTGGYKGYWLGITSTSWNNCTNWCGCVPASETNVVIPYGTTYSPQVDIASALCNNLTINPVAGLTLNNVGALSVNGTFLNAAGSSGLVLDSDASGTASLIHNSGSVTATISRYISGPAQDWHFLSSPVETQSITGAWLPSGTYGNGTGYDLYAWNEPTLCWIYQPNTSTTVNWATIHPESYYVPGRGYLYSMQATNQTNTFKGNLNNGIINYPITDSGAVTSENVNGFNLVGNPYPSSVDWQAYSGWDRSNLADSGAGYDMWIWNPSAANYGVCNSASGSTGTNSVTQYIAPMQGFFVRAIGSGNLGFSNPVRVHSNSADWKSALLKSESISIVAQSERDKTSDEARILFGYPANQSGAAKLFSPVTIAPALYLAEGGADYTVRYLTDTIAYPSVPIAFKPGSDGAYTLAFSFDSGTFNNVSLEDKQTNVIRNLKTEPYYRFNASVGDPANRFALHFTPIKAGASNELPAKIYTDGYNLIVDLTKVTGKSHLAAYDILGRKRYEVNLPGETLHTLSFISETQLLIIELKNPMGQLVRKIVCNHTSE